MPLTPRWTPLQQPVARERVADVRRARPRRTRPAAAAAARRRGRASFSAALTRRRAGGDEHRGVDLLQRRVDLRARVRLVVHAAHLRPDDVRGDADAAGAADVQAARRRCRRCRRGRRARRSAAARRELACLTGLDAVDLRQLGEQVGRHVGRRARRGCCRGSPACRRRPWRPPRSARRSRAGSACCSTGVTDSTASTPGLDRPLGQVDRVARVVGAGAGRRRRPRRPARAAISSTSPRCSSSVIVAASPVVPATTSPCEPLPSRWRPMRDRRLLVDGRRRRGTG